MQPSRKMEVKMPIRTKTLRQLVWRFSTVLALLLAPLLATASVFVMPAPSALAAPIQLGPYPIDISDTPQDTIANISYTIYQPGDTVPSTGYCPSQNSSTHQLPANVYCYTYVLSNSASSPNPLNQFQEGLPEGVTIYSIGYDTLDTASGHKIPNNITLTGVGLGNPTPGNPVLVNVSANTQYTFNQSSPNNNIVPGTQSVILYFEADLPPGPSNGTVSRNGGTSGNAYLPGFAPVLAQIAAQTGPLPQANPGVLGPNGEVGLRVAPDSYYNYTIFFNNPSTVTTLHGVTITDILPSDISFDPNVTVSYSGTTATFVSSTHNYSAGSVTQTFDTYDVGPGQQIAITFGVHMSLNPNYMRYYIKPFSTFNSTTTTGGVVSLPPSSNGVPYVGPQAFDVSDLPNTIHHNPTGGCDATSNTVPNTCQNLNTNAYQDNKGSAAPVILYFNAVYLNSFKAGSSATGKGMEVRWQTGFERANAGFNVYRADKQNGSYVKLNSQPVKSIQGGALGPKNYSFSDPSGKPGQWYRVEDIDLNGKATQHPALRAEATALAAVANQPATNLPVHPTLPTLVKGVVHNNQFTSTLKFFTEADGVYRISYADLQGAGLTLTNLKSSQIHITTAGRSIQVATNTPDNLNANTYFEFYAQSNKSSYTEETAFYLNFDGNGPSVVPANTSVRGLSSLLAVPLSKTYDANSHFEQDNQYLYNMADEHPWGWNYVTNIAANGPATRDFHFTLSNLPLDTSSNLVKLTGVLSGSSLTNDPHNAQLKVNGQVVAANVNWNGDNTQTFSVSFPQSWLVTGDNVLNLQVTSDPTLFADAITLEYFDVAYTRTPRAVNNQLTATLTGNTAVLATGFTDSQVVVYDITNPNQPQRLNLNTIKTADGTYGVVLSNVYSSRRVHSGTNGQDESKLIRSIRFITRTYYVVGNSGHTNVTALAANNPANLKSQANSTDMLIISNGNFLSQAQQLAQFHISQGIRTTVVNVDDIYDQFNYGNASPQAIKDFLAYAHSNWSGPAPKWVLLLGGGTYNYLGYSGPDIVPSGASLVPTHYFRSEAQHTRAVDDNWYVAGADGLTPMMAIGRLPAQSQAEATNAVNNIIAYTNNSASGAWRSKVNFVADVLDADGNPLSTPTFANDSNVIQSGLPSGYSSSTYYNGNQGDGVAAINAGAGIINYLGHGGYEQWSLNNILQSSDATNWTNASQRSLVVHLSCFTSDYGFDTNALAWKLVSNPNGGAIASLAATSWTEEGSDVAVGQTFYARMLGSANLTIGEATQQTMASLAAQGKDFSDTIQTYSLIGDPALHLAR